MKRVSQDHYDSRDPIRSIYQGGLKSVFAACRDPLPKKMEELVDQGKTQKAPQPRGLFAFFRNNQN
jgi:hypothetical protein